MPYVTLADLSARILARLDGNTLLYPQARITSSVNESIRILGLMTGLFQKTIQFVSQPSRIWYALPPGVLVYPGKVMFNNTYLQPTSFLQLGRAKPNWVTDTSANQLTGPASWIPYGFHTIALHPSDSIGGNLIYVTGAAEPPQLVNPTDTILLNNSVFAAFDELGVLNLVLKESPKTFAQASTNYQAFLRIIKEQTIYRSWIAPRYYVESAQSIKRG